VIRLPSGIAFLVVRQIAVCTLKLPLRVVKLVVSCVRTDGRAFCVTVYSSVFICWDILHVNMDVYVELTS